jgi:hypothetical protein
VNTEWEDCAGWIKQDPISKDTQSQVEEIYFSQPPFTHLYAHAIILDCTYYEQSLHFRSLIYYKHLEMFDY